MTIIEVAEYVALTYEKIFNEVIDEMKLHKLLYFIQREYIAKYDKPLFNESFEGWTYGPVSRDVRNNLENIIANKTKPILNDEKLVNDVIFQYAPINSSELSEISHLDTSWKNARKGLGKYDKCNKVLSLDDIKYDALHNKNKEYFEKSIDPNLKSFIDNIDESELTDFAL